MTQSRNDGRATVRW